MTPRELTSLARALGGVIREQVTKAIGDLTAKFDGLEQRVAAIPAGPSGAQGEKGAPGTPAPSVDIQDGPPAIEGKTGDIYIDRLTGDLYKCA